MLFMRWRPVLVLGCVLSGCAHGPPLGGELFVQQARYRPLTPPSPPRTIPVGSEPALTPFTPTLTRSELVEKAQAWVGRAHAGDCAGFVRDIYAEVGLPLQNASLEQRDNAVIRLYRVASARGRLYASGHPLPGDLVFFRETYDLNRDGRSNDGLTHVGIVESEDPESGTIHVIHRASHGVIRNRMNIRRPNEKRDPATGKVLNDALRAHPGTTRSVLTGQLFATFASVFPESTAQR